MGEATSDKCILYHMADRRRDKLIDGADWGQTNSRGF